MVRPSKDGGSTSKENGGARNRATPARLFKLYKSTSDDQKKLIDGVGFGGLLKLGSGRLPSSLSKWLVKHLDAESEELVIPGRGKIKVNAPSVQRILGLPMGQDAVRYKFNGSAINFINDKCNFEDGRAPSITSIIARLQANKEANDDYLRCWLMVAVSTFLCGSTALCISPKCYPSVVDLSKVENLNWCQFVVDTLKSSLGKMDRKDAVLGCLYFLTILYLDSLELRNIQVPEKSPRIAAWNMKLINNVIKLDTNINGSFGKLKLEKLAGSVTESSLLGDLDDIENFISHRASAGMSAKTKRRFSEIVSKACIGFTEVMGTFISEVSAISDDSENEEGGRCRRSKRRRSNNAQQETDFIDDDENDSDYNVDEDEEEDEVTEEEEEEDDDEEVELEDDDEVEPEDDGVELNDESAYEKDDPPKKVDTSGDGPKSKGNTISQKSARERTHYHGDNTDVGDMLIVQPVPIEVILSQKSKKERLRLPSTSAAPKSEKPEDHTKWDFSGPSFDLMAFIESPTLKEGPQSNS